MANKKTTIAVIQNCCVEDNKQNLATADLMIREAAGRGAHIICLQELFLSPYFCQVENHKYFACAEPIPGPTTQHMQALACELGVVIIAPIFEKRAPGIYHNTAVILDADGTYLGKYRKMHIPDDPLFYEKFYFTPGDLGFLAWETKFARIGVGICWDQWYPEAARLMALSGAQILFYPTAIGWQPPEKAEYGELQYHSWETIQRSHAIANGCYVAVPNRVGYEASDDGGHGIEFWGQSFICHPSGEILAKASEDKNEALLVSVDLDALDVQRTHWPFLRDRRIDAYENITKRFID